MRLEFNYKGKKKKAKTQHMEGKQYDTKQQMGHLRNQEIPGDK